MPAIKLLNIFALSTLAVLLCSFAPSQSLAVSVQANHLARQLPHHNRIVKKKRDTKRCKPRSSSVPPSSTPAPGPTSSSSKDDPPKTTVPPNNDLSPSTTQPPQSVSTSPPTSTASGSKKLGIAWALGNDKRFNLITGGGHVAIVHLWDAVIPDIVKSSGLPVSIMLWGTAQDKINDFVKYAKPGYAQYAYGFNEYANLIWLLSVYPN